jgi:hypothetical protein
MIDIKQTVSNHSVSLDLRRWARPSLDPSILNKLLETLLEGTEMTTTVGKKRPAEDPDIEAGPLKRQKFTDITSGARAQKDVGGEVGPKVLAFKHTYHFVFTLFPSDTNNINTTASKDYRKEVEALLQTSLRASTHGTLSECTSLTSIVPFCPSMLTILSTPMDLEITAKSTPLVLLIFLEPTTALTSLSPFAFSQL